MLHFFDIRSINPVEISDPINAARISVYEENLPIYFKYTIIVSATTIFAPEEIPRTKGPAIGLEKMSAAKSLKEIMHHQAVPPSEFSEDESSI